MSENLLTPKSDAPAGVPPKNIIAFIGLGLLIVIGAASMWRDSTTSSPAEDKKKATLQESTATTDVGVKGNPKDVSAAADAAGTPAALRGPLAAASVPAIPALPASAAVLEPYPFPPGARGTAGSLPAGGQTMDAVRDTEIANAKAIVFDVSTATADSTRKVEDPIQKLIEQERLAQSARADANAKAGDLSQISSVLSSQQPKVQPVGRASDQAWLKEFSTNRRDSGIRPSSPESELMLIQGSAIEAVTLREINSDAPGVITARTTRDIYDSTTQRVLILPKGSLAIGEYSSDIKLGQQRLLFAFSRLVLPNGQSFDLTAFNGSDATGRAGLKGDVDNHYFRLFGVSLMIGVLADRVVATRAVPQGTNGQAGGLSATGQILTETVKSILDKNREISPTLSIPSGARLVIEVKRDMVFPSPYRG